MKNFMDKDFLLETETAKNLYHHYASNMPIFDYHCHINVNEILEDKSYRNITELWLGGDHYKWRAMRLYGFDESYMTGDKSDIEKFYAYAETIEHAIGNPLYHWTHLELQRYFGIFETLSRSTAKDIYEKANKMLADGLTTRKFIELSNVSIICSTDDPIDDLRHHIGLKEEGYAVQVLPTFRPDKAIHIENDGYLEYIDNLSKTSSIAIHNIDDVCNALKSRLEYFVNHGCVITDHAFNTLPFIECEKDCANDIFQKKISRESISSVEIEKYQTYLMGFLSDLYNKNGLIMQLHLGALRSNNTKMVNILGPDTGFDSIDDGQIAKNVSVFLNSLEMSDRLPKTILYTLNPKDNYVLATMMGNFPSSEVATKVQFGTAWWFNDQRDGMVDHIKAFSNLGMISKFIGMLTDSRSFTSYTRHEYFRRILCNIFGAWVENGEYPQDQTQLGNIVQDICYNNIIKYFYG